jgi:hypothetical protein
LVTMSGDEAREISNVLNTSLLVYLRLMPENNVVTSLIRNLLY